MKTEYAPEPMIFSLHQCKAIHAVMDYVMMMGFDI
jgi:hypothetical protein